MSASFLIVVVGLSQNRELLFGMDDTIFQLLVDGFFDGDQPASVTCHCCGVDIDGEYRHLDGSDYCVPCVQLAVAANDVDDQA